MSNTPPIIIDWKDKSEQNFTRVCNFCTNVWEIVRKKLLNTLVSEHKGVNLISPTLMKIQAATIKWEDIKELIIELRNIVRKNIVRKK